MSWNRIRETARTLAFRLNLWHAAIFSAGALVLFVLVWHFLALAIDQKDREVLDAQLREYAAVYETGGARALNEWVTRAGEAHRQATFFVRVTKPPHQTSILIVPKDWVREDLRLLEEGGRMRLDEWLRIPRDGLVDLTVTSAVLRDGATIQVGRASDSRDRFLGRFARFFSILIPSMLVLGLVGGAFFARRATRPLRQVLHTIHGIIRTGRFDLRVPVPAARDELHELTLAFNRMLAGNQALFSALRDSLDNVAHDLRTPLARLRAIVENALRHADDPAAAQEALVESLEETQRVQTIIDTLMDVAQAQAGMMRLDPQATDLGLLIDDVIELYAYVAEEKQVSVHKTFSGTLPAPVDAARMRQAFANLLDNAIKFTPAGGSVTITAQNEAKHAVVRFRDTGTGIAPEHRPRIWDRLYRGDKSRTERGLGLGLSLVKAIVEAHGGSVHVKSEPGQGTEFELRLPLQLRETPRTSSGSNSTAPSASPADPETPGNSAA